MSDSPKKTDDNQNPGTTPLDALLSARKAFNDAIAPLEAGRKEIDKEIARLKQEKEDAARVAEIRDLTGGSQTALKDRNIVFLLNAKGGVLDTAIASAQKVSSVLSASGVKDAVAARYWGDQSKTYSITLTGKDNTTKVPNQGHFLPAMKEILPENVKGKKNNYIIVSSGALADDTAALTDTLKAVTQLNPEATFDFVVCNEKETKFDDLVRKLSEGETAS